MDFIRFHGKRHARELGVGEIRAHLSYQATEKDGTTSTQNMALSTLLFLCNDDDHNDEGRTLTVVGKTPENKVLDLGAQGPSQGDLIVTNAPIYDESGKERIGRFDLLCAITDPADESSEKAHMAQCTKTFTLPGGQISVQGVEAYPNLSGLSPGVNAISGGTGKYAGVEGEQRFEVRGKQVINIFHFIE